MGSTMLAERRPPAEILARLRDVDPAAELVYQGVGKDPETGEFTCRWVAGVMRYSRPASEAAIASIGRELENQVSVQRDARIEYLRLCATGFRPIAEYWCNVADDRIVTDFRERDWNYRNRRDVTFRENAWGSDTEKGERERQAVMLEKVQADFADIHRIILRGARSFTSRVIRSRR